MTIIAEDACIIGDVSLHCLESRSETPMRILEVPKMLKLERRPQLGHFDLTSRGSWRT